MKKIYLYILVSICMLISCSTGWQKNGTVAWKYQVKDSTNSKYFVTLKDSLNFEMNYEIFDKNVWNIIQVGDSVQLSEKDNIKSVRIYKIN